MKKKLVPAEFIERMQVVMLQKAEAGKHAAWDFPDVSKILGVLVSDYSIEMDIPEEKSDDGERSS